MSKGIRENGKTNQDFESGDNTPGQRVVQRSNAVTFTH
jgi:hypothetical protein